MKSFILILLIFAIAQSQNPTPFNGFNLSKLPGDWYIGWYFESFSSQAVVNCWSWNVTETSDPYTFNLDFQLNYDEKDYFYKYYLKADPSTNTSWLLEERAQPVDNYELVVIDYDLVGYTWALAADPNSEYAILISSNPVNFTQLFVQAQSLLLKHAGYSLSSDNEHYINNFNCSNQNTSIVW